MTNSIPLQHSAPVLLAILPCFSGGGAERVTVNILNGLAAHGIAAGLIVINSEGPLSASLAPGIPVADLGQDSLHHSLWALLREIRSQRPRVVYSTLGYINVALLGLRRFLPRGTQIWIREANLPSISLPNNPHPRLMRSAYRWLYPRADRVIATSERMRAELADEFAVPERKLKLLRNPVDDGEIRRCAEALRPKREQGRLFIAAGRLIPQKGFDRLLRYLADLHDTDSRLVILGDGSQGEYLARLASELGICEHVRFEGYVSNPWNYFAIADAFLLPSRWEGMSNAVLEALACGVPVIATPESGGISEVAEQAQPGAVTVVAAGPDFVAAMRRVLAGRGTGLRPSLLPAAYRIASVIDHFEKWLYPDA